MKTVLKRSKHLIAIALIGFTMVSGLLPHTSSKASAVVAPPDTGAVGTFYTLSVADQSTFWTKYRAALSQQCKLRNPASLDEIRTGNWFDGTSVKVGHHVEPDDAQVGCGNEKNWFSSLLDAAGYSGNYIDPAKRLYNRSGDTFTANGNGKDVLQSMLSGKPFQGSQVPSSAPDQVTYYVLYNNFTANKACNASVAPSDANGQAGLEAKDYIYVYDDATNTVVRKLYGYHKAGSGIGIGYGIPVPGAGDATLSCRSIAEALGNKKFADGYAAYLAANPSTAPGGTSSSGGTTDPNLECHVSANPLTWFLCPIVIGMNAFIVQLDNGITSLLKVDQVKIFETGSKSGNAYHAAWQTFRSFALAILVIAALAMVIAQGLGFEVLDAYAIKKIFPRLALAIIGIALSWEIMKFFVVLTNDLGFGIRQIIYAPFHEMDNSLELGGGAQVIMGILGGSAIAVLGIVGLLSFAGTAALAIIVAVLVLIVRQLVIIVLVLFAPIAIACSILPNTQSVYKLWYESFTKALMMFPIIVAFLAVGRVFAVTSVGSDIGKATAISQLVGFAAYIMPYFLIPFTFKFAGGAMRALGGSLNDRSRGGFDRLKKYRGTKVAKNMHDMKTGNRIKSDNWAAKRFNNTTSNVAAMPHAGMNPLKMKQRLRSHQSNEGMLAAGEYAEKNAAFQAVKNNDDFLIAGVEGKGSDRKVYDILRQKGYDDVTAQQGTAAIRAARRDTSAEVFDTAATLALPATGTAFQGGAGEMHDAINEVAGEDRVKAGRMLAAMRGGAGQARRFDIAGGGFGDQISTLEDQYHGKISATQASQHIFESSLEGQGGQYIAGARKSAVKNFAPVMVRNLDTQITSAAASGNSAGVDRELAVIAGRYDAMSSSSPENARVLAENVLGQVKTIDGETATVQQHIESRRQSAQFTEMRREYGGSAAAAANALQQQRPDGPQQPVMPPPIKPPGA